MRQCYSPSLLPDITHILTLVYLLGTACLNPCIHNVPVFLTPFLPSLTSLYSLLTSILQGAIYMPPLFHLALPGENRLCPSQCFMELSA